MLQKEILTNLFLINFLFIVNNTRFMMIIVLFRTYNFNIRLKYLNMMRSTFNSIFLMTILTIINYNAQAAAIANVGANTVYIFLLNN